MSVLRIPADYDDAFSHMLGFGLASILKMPWKTAFVDCGGADGTP